MLHTTFHIASPSQLQVSDSTSLTRALGFSSGVIKTGGYYNGYLIRFLDTLAGYDILVIRLCFFGSAFALLA